MKMMLRKTLALVLAILMVVGMFPVHQTQEISAAGGTMIYLKPNSNWLKDGARFAVYYWTGSGDDWVNMTKVETGVYKAEIPSCTGFKFVRLNGSGTENNFNDGNRWNETGNLTLQSEKNCYSIASDAWSFGNGTWGTYTPSVASYTVTNSCTNISFSGTSATSGQAFSTTLKPATGYKLPDSITVTVGGTKLGSSDYSYDKSSGALTINASKVTGNITITGSAVKNQVDVSEGKYVFLNPGVWTADNATFTVHYWYDSNTSGDVLMTKNEADGIYYAEIPADVTNLMFFRNNPAGGI